MTCSLFKVSQRSRRKRPGSRSVQGGKALQQVSKITQSISGTCLPSVSDETKHGSRQRLFARLAKDANASVLALASAFTSKSRQKLLLASQGVERNSHVKNIASYFSRLRADLTTIPDTIRRRNLVWDQLDPPRCSAQIIFQCERLMDQSLTLTIGSRTFQTCLIFVRMASRRAGNGGQPL